MARFRAIFWPTYPEGMASGPHKGQPLRIWFQDQEYVSVLGAAQMLGMCVVRLKTNSDSGRILTLLPAESEHRFRVIPNT